MMSEARGSPIRIRAVAAMYEIDLSECGTLERSLPRIGGISFLLVFICTEPGLDKEIFYAA